MEIETHTLKRKFCVCMTERDKALQDLEAEREKRLEAERKVLALKSSIHPDCEQASEEIEEHFQEKTYHLQSKHDQLQSNLTKVERQSERATNILTEQIVTYWARHRLIGAQKKMVQRRNAMNEQGKQKLPRGSFRVDVSGLQTQRKPGDAGELLVDSQVMDDDSRLSTGQKHNLGRGRGSKGFKRGANSYRNIAGIATTTTTKAPTRKRDSGGGGIEKDEKFVSVACLSYCETTLSVKVAASGHSDIQARLATNVVYEAEPLRSHSYRGKLDPNKGPVDVFGKVSKSCLLAALFPFFWAIDILLWPFFKTADALSLSLDISPVGSCHLLGCQLRGSKIIEAGTDAAGNPLLDVLSFTHPTFAAHVHNKMVEMWSNPKRDAAGVQSTSVAILVSALLAISNLLVALLTHDCVFLILDAGMECTGNTGKKKAIGGDPMITFNGAGGINHEVFMLRKAPQQIYISDGPILDLIAAFFGENPAKNRSACAPRDHPPVLKTNEPIKAVSRKLVILERTPVVKQKEILSTRSETLPNTRTSTEVNPFSYGLLALGGAPTAFHCVKHGNSIAIGETLKFREENMKQSVAVGTWIRNGYNWLVMKSGIEMLLCARVDDGCVKKPRIGSMHFLAAADVDFIQNSTELMQARKNGVRKFVQGIDVRWLSRDKSIAQMAAFLNLCAAAMILALGCGLTDIKVEMAKHVLSGKGFVEDKRVRFSSKVERNIFCLTEPHFILDAWVTKLILMIAWVPIDDASARFKGASLSYLGGVDSVIRKVLYVLKRLLFVNVCGTWRLECKLAHRGVLSVTPVGGKDGGGLLLLRSFHPEIVTETETKPESRGARTLKEIFGPMYDVAGMLDVLNSLMRVIQCVSMMKGRDDEILPLGPMREKFNRTRRNNYEPMSIINGRILAANWLVRESAMLAAEAIENRHRNLLFNPLGYLAQSARPKMRNLTPHGKVEPESFAVSDEVSRANIAILSVILEEFRQHFKDVPGELSEYMNGPLKPIVANWDASISSMKSFVRGSQLNISEIGTLNEPEGTNLAVPLSSFPCIHRPAILAFSQNISNDSIEAGWSLTSTKFRQGCKAATALFWGTFVRRPMARMHAARLAGLEYLSIFRKARQFVRENEDALNHLRTADQEANDDEHEARVQSRLPGYVKKGAPFREKKQKDQTSEPPLNDEAASNSTLKAARKGKKSSKKLGNTTTSDAGDSVQSASDEDDCRGGGRESASDDEDSCEDSDISDGDDIPAGEDGDEGQAESMVSADDQESAVGPGNPEPNSDSELPTSKEACPECQPGMAVEERTHTQSQSAEGGGKSGNQLASESEPRKGIDDSSDNDSSVEGDQEALRLSKACYQLETDGNSESDKEELDRPLFPRAVSSGGADMPCNDSSWTHYPLNDLDPKKTWESFKNKTESCLRCLYTLRMLQQREWKDSVVTAKQKAGVSKSGSLIFFDSVTLQRLDGIKFDVKKESGNTFQIVYLEDGLHCIWITSLFQKNGKIRAQYYRAVSTQKAIDETPYDDDLVFNENTKQKHMGARNLRNLLEKEALYPPDSRGRTFHWGNVLRETDVGNVVGGVAWISEEFWHNPSDGLSQLKVECTSEKSANFNWLRQNIDKMDWVFCGRPFNEKDVEPPPSSPSHVSTPEVARSGVCKMSTRSRGKAGTLPTAATADSAGARAGSARS